MEKIQFVAYETMVSALFTKAKFNSAENLMHATTGMIGEAAEIMDAIKLEDDKNLKEELGDFYFYLVAAYLTLGHSIALGGMETSLTMPAPLELVIASGDCLDLAKKTWVYSKELNVKTMSESLDFAHCVFTDVVTESKFDLDDIIYDNQFKLIGPGGRFEGMVYTDAAAIARADKVEA